MRIGVGRCLRTARSTKSAVVRDNTVQGVTLSSLESLEGRNSVKTCPNEAKVESIDIYAKSTCQWISCLIKVKLKSGRYGHLNLQGP